MTKDFLFDKQIPDPFTRSAADTSNPEKNVTAIGWARARDGTGWQLVLAFADRDGRRHEVLAKRCDIARGEGLFELLDHHGYPVPANPLTRAELRRSITSAEPEPRFWMEGRGRLVPDHESAKVQVAVDRIIEQLPKLAKHALDLRKRKHRVDAKLAASAAALRIKLANGERLLALLPATLKSITEPEIPGKAIVVAEKAIVVELERRGVLIPRSNGRRTRELRLPGGKIRRSYYCLRYRKDGKRLNRTE